MISLEVEPASRRVVKQLICRIFGHSVVNHRIGEARGKGTRCSCGEPLLRKDEAAVHVRHNLVCFMGGHSYTKLGERAGHCEYCGHPLLFERETSPYARQEYFRKFVRHRCGWFGHVVHTVSERCGLTEYACHCGHSFLLQAKGLTKIRHPLLCVVTGHRIGLLTRRSDQLEFRCRDCGHPFCLADGLAQRPGLPESELSTITAGPVAVKRNVFGVDFLRVNAVMRVALFAAQTFFLWMFFVAGGLERLAELGHIAGPAGVNVKAVVFDFTARWRAIVLPSYPRCSFPWYLPCSR